MISYEELCQALDRYNGRRNNEAELAQLDQDAAPEQQPLPSDVPLAQAEEAPDAAMIAAQAAAAAEMPAETDDATTIDHPPLSDDEAGFAAQPAENTHEIDVDDMVVDQRLPEDKVPGE